MIRDTFVHETARIAGIICAIHDHQSPVKSGYVKRNQQSRKTHQNNGNKYLVKVLIANGKEITALLDTGASHSFIQRECVLRNQLATIPLPTARTFGQASSGRIVVNSQVRTDIVTPFGRIEESLINVADISHEMLVGRDLLDQTDIILCLELANCGLTANQIQELSMKMTKDLHQHVSEPEVQTPCRETATSSSVGKFGAVHSGNLPMSASNAEPSSVPLISKSQCEKITRDIIRDYPDVFQEKLPNHIPSISASTILHEIRLKDSAKEKPTRGYYPIAYKYYTSGKKVVFDHIAAKRLIPQVALR